MADLQLPWGGDLTVAPGGDLLLVDGDALGVQRVLRRLLTNPGDLVFHAEYGAGLGSFVGQAAPQRMAALIAAQAVQESAVARTPAPQVGVTSTADGTLTAVLRYTSATTGAGQQLSVQPGV
jgi:phage baseplate assembly protein W